MPGMQEPDLLGAHDEVLDVLELVGQLKEGLVQHITVHFICVVDQIA